MIELKINQLDVDTYLSLRNQVGWNTLTSNQASKALYNSLYTVLACHNGIPVGMGRLVGDGAVICYVQDLIVIPNQQGSGVGSMILEQLKTYVQALQLENSTMMLCLMCAKGREGFYESHGFIARPTDQLGPGMIQYLYKPSNS